MREVWEGIAPRRDAGYEAFAAAVVRTSGRRERGAVARGASVDWDGVSLEVLGPAAARGAALAHAQRRFGGAGGHASARCTLSLTGDIEAAGERALDAAACRGPEGPAPREPDEHERRPPRSGPAALAVVSAGFRNHFGHPHPEVLHRSPAARGVRVFRDRPGRDGPASAPTGRRLWVAPGAARCRGANALGPLELWYDLALTPGAGVMTEEPKSFTVKDRRHFTPDGRTRESDEPEAPKARPPRSGPRPPRRPFRVRGRRSVSGGAAGPVDFGQFLLSLGAQAGMLLAGPVEGLEPARPSRRPAP